MRAASLSTQSYGRGVGAMERASERTNTPYVTPTTRHGGATSRIRFKTAGGREDGRRMGARRMRVSGRWRDMRVTGRERWRARRGAGRELDAIFTVCEKLYRVHFVRHTANRLFVTCLECSTRQIYRHTANKMFAVCRAIKHMVNIYTRQKSLLCRVFLLSTRQI